MTVFEDYTLHSDSTGRLGSVKVGQSLPARHKIWTATVLSMATLKDAEQTSLAPPAHAAYEDAREAAEATVRRDDYALGLLYQGLCCLGQRLPAGL